MSFNTEKFAEITGKTHTEQAIWFLNGFWADGLEAEAEKIWEITHLFLEIQLDRPVRYGRKLDEFKEESDLEEHRSHRLLEKMGETQTVTALRKRLQGLDIDNNHRMAVTELLLDRYKKTPDEVVKSPQGNIDPEKLAAAQAACDASMEAFSAAQDEVKRSTAAAAASVVALAASEKAAAEAAESKANADAAEAEAVAAADQVRAAEAELQASIDEITQLEETKAAKIKAFEDKIANPDTSAMKKAMANNELAQVKSEDSMPLRKAKITQKAALKKVTKAKKLAEEKEAAAKAVAAQAASDKVAADDAAAAAAAAKAEADAAAAAAEVAEKAAEEAAAEAQAQLEELKKSSSTPHGQIWWMERVMAEKKKFMR